MDETQQDSNIDVSLGSHGENEEYIKLAVNETPDAFVHLSLKQARLLAIALIQQVHRAEVSSKLKHARQKSTQTALERSGAPVFGTPDSQQA